MKKVIVLAALTAVGVEALSAELKLSLQAYTFRDRSFVETVETAARLGYANLEAYPGQRLGGNMKGSTDYHSISPEALAQLKAYLATAPVKVVSYGVTGAGSDQEWEKLMAFCRELGIGQVQVEVGIEPDNLARAERHAKAAGVRVSLHNHRQPAGRPENVLKALEGFGPMIGAGCDIGHWQNSGVDPVAAVKMLKGKFHCIHAIDSSGPSGGSRDVALGSGVMDLVTILNELKANETGMVYVTVEDEWQHADLESAVAASARWFKAWERGELSADGRLRDDAVGGLWTGMTGADAATWDLEALGVGENAEAKVAQMRAIGLEPASLKSDSKGMNEKEEVDGAFAGRDRKFCRQWKKNAFVSCEVKSHVAAKYYTIGSANDGQDRDPKSWVLYGSKDGSQWVEIDRQTGQRFLFRNFLRGYQIKKPEVFRNYKLEFLENNGAELLQFSRVAFYE